MTKITKNEKILRKGNEKWKNFLAEGAFKKTVKEWDEDDTYHFDQDKHGPEEYTAAANFKMGDVVKVMNRGKPKFDEPEELRCRVGTVVGMDGMNLTLKFENGEEATITYFNARRDEHGLWDSKNLYKCPEEQVSEGVEPREGDYVNIIGGALTGAVGKVIELTTTGGIGIEGGLPALVVRLTKSADKPIYGGKGDEVIVQPKFVEVDSGLYGAQVNEARMGEYGKIDAEDGNPPTKIGHGNEEYMAAYNAVLVARGEEPLPIVKPDQAYLDALRSGNLEEASAGDDLAAVSNAVAMLGQLKKDIDKGFASTITAAMLELNKIQNYLEKEQGGQLEETVRKAVVKVLTEKKKFKLKESNMEMSLQSKAKGKAMGLLQTAKAMAKAPSTEPARGFAAAVANAAGEIVDLMVELEGFQASRTASLGENEKKNLKEEVIEDFEIELEDGVTFADVEEAGLVTPGVDSVIDNGDGYAQVYSEPGAMAKMAKTLEAMTGVMVTPKSHGPVDERSEDDERDLEKPVKYGSGAELEFDKKAQKFYDRKRDMYIDDKEEEDNLIKEKDEKEFAKIFATAKDMLVLSARSRVPVTLKSVQSALDVIRIPSEMEKGKLIVKNEYVIADKDELPETAKQISFTRYAMDYLSNLEGEQQDLPLG